MKPKHNYKSLKIWQRALQIAFGASDVLETFPKKEQYKLTSQMSRCSISIPSNMAEGSSRTDKSFNRFLDISLEANDDLWFPKEIRRLVFPLFL